ncbi:MAG: hypothetical protein GF344_11480 [Chitinivibrionales bacterium]|nr:hypothetical protein [Chitinivibrionales bacterium]MBD3357418.1 hypothetical protein [Chitinivibrionales bacterium]
MKVGAWFTDERFARVMIAILAGGFVGYFVYFPLVNTDIWWHLAAGRKILANTSFLYTDPFAYTLEQPKWIDVHWLFQVSVYAIMRAFGAGGLVLTKSIVVAGAVILLCLVRRSVPYTVATGLALALFMYQARHLVLMRPIVITLLCLAFYFFVLERFREGGKSWWLALLVPAQIIWVNSQGLFVLGPVVLGCYLAGTVMEYVAADETARPVLHARVIPLTACLLGLACACFVNPYGWEGALLPVKLFGRINPSEANIFSRNISENVPLLELRGGDVRYVYAVSAVTALLIIVGFLNRGSLVPAHVLTWLGFLALAYMAKRNILLYLFLAAPIAGVYVDRVAATAPARARRDGKRIAMHFAGAVGIAILAVNVVWHAAAITVYPRDSALGPFRYPREAVVHLKDNPVEGRVFNADRYGGYLMWEMYPDRRVFVDGRMVIRTPAFFAEYLAILERPDLYFEGVAKKFGITHAVLPTARYRIHMPLVKWLYDSPRWDLVFTDGASVVYVENGFHSQQKLDIDDPVCVDSIRQALKKRWKYDDEIRAQAVVYLEELVEKLTGRARENAKNVKPGRYAAKIRFEAKDSGRNKKICYITQCGIPHIRRGFL